MTHAWSWRGWRWGDAKHAGMKAQLASHARYIQHMSMDTTMKLPQVTVHNAAKKDPLDTSALDAKTRPRFTSSGCG